MTLCHVQDVIAARKIHLGEFTPTYTGCQQRGRHINTPTHGFSLMTHLTAEVRRSSTEDEILLQHDAFNCITLPSQV